MARPEAGHLRFAFALMSDRARLPRPEIAMRAAGPGGALIFRDYDDPRRFARGLHMRALCRSLGWAFIVAGDPVFAARLGADGHHRPRWAPAPPHGAFSIASMAVHGEQDLLNAEAASLLIVSPVFATRSHPGAPTLGVAGLDAIAARTSAPVFALGGIDCGSAPALIGSRAAGLAAIGAFI